MSTEQKKVSLTIETDWMTFDYVDRLSKNLEQIEQSIQHIQEETETRLEDLRSWQLFDPTEWLDDLDTAVDKIKTRQKKQQQELEGLGQRMDTQQEQLQQLAEKKQVEQLQTVFEEGFMQLMEIVQKQNEQIVKQQQTISELQVSVNNVPQLLEAQKNQLEQIFAGKMNDFNREMDAKFKQLLNKFEMRSPEQAFSPSPIEETNKQEDTPND